MPVEQLPTVSVWPLKKREELHKAHALWLVRSKRAFTLPEDNEYRELWQRALQGAYTPPDRKTVKAHVVMLSKEGLDYIVSVNKALTETGLKVAIAGDIWSDRGVSILGICQYHIDENFKIHELVRRRLLRPSHERVLTVAFCVCRSLLLPLSVTRVTPARPSPARPPKL